MEPMVIFMAAPCSTKRGHLGEDDRVEDGAETYEEEMDHTLHFLDLGDSAEAPRIMEVWPVMVVEVGSSISVTWSKNLSKCSLF